MLDYYLEPNTLTGAAPGTYRAVVTQQESAEGDAYVKMAAKTLNISEGETIGLLNGLAQAAQTLIGQGWGFKLPGFGSFGFSIRGSFDGPDAPYDPSVQKVGLSFRLDRALVAAAQTAPKNRIHGVVHGPVIDAVVDMTANTTNSTLHPGGNTKISGKNIKIAGTAPSNGIRIVDEVGDSSPVAPAAISRNSPTELVFICPNLPAGTYQVRVTTQYANSSTLADTPRSYTFESELTVPQTTKQDPAPGGKTHKGSK
jgi:hypothetical protein